ncbi:AAA family ATPase [Leifsonia aquatica]|uniref:AAA family ATPase n=1 Tax=Leifsonia aquatica TaxID=144185 RepID=UPI003828BCA1
MAERDKLDLSRRPPGKHWRDLTVKEREAEETRKTEAWLREQARADDPHEAEVQDQIRRRLVSKEAERRIASDAASKSFGGFRGLSLGEALAQPREKLDPIIGSLQGSGHKVTLTAQHKAGKTTTTSNVTRALADGGPLFDDERFFVRQLNGNVVVFDYELTEDDALDMYAVMGIRNMNKVFVESFRGNGLSLANEFVAEAVRDYLNEHDAEYWNLDPFGRSMRGFGSENDNDDVRRFLDTVDRIVAETGVRGVLLTAHTGRAQHEVGAEHARGATVLDDDADVRWLLSKDPKGNRFFRAEGRQGISVSEFRLELDSSANSLRASRTTRADIKADAHRPHILEFISAFERVDPQTGKAIDCSGRKVKQAIKGDDKEIDLELKALVAEGTLVAAPGTRGSNYYLAGEEPKA